MATKKLTLSVEETIIERGKIYARNAGTSLSKLFEEFMRGKIVDQVARDQVTVIEVSDYVNAIPVGDGQQNEGQTYKELYAEYMEHLYNKGR